MPTLRQWGIYPVDAAFRRHRGMDLRGLPKDRQKRGLGMITDDEKRELIAEAGRVNDDLKMNALGVRLGIIDRLADALEGTLTDSKAPPPGKRLDPEFRAQLVDFAAGTIQDVWNDVPGGVDAITLAQNIVGAQEFAWIARGFPVVLDV